MKKKKISTSQSVTSEIMDGTILDNDDEVLASESIEGIRGNNYFPLYQMRLQNYEYDFIRSYLFSLYTGVRNNDKLVVENYNALASYLNPVIMHPNVISVDSSGQAEIANDTVFANLLYLGNSYQVTVFAKTIDCFDSRGVKYFVSVLGNSQDSLNTEEVASYITKISTQESFYRKKILQVDPGSEEKSWLDITECHEDFTENTFDKIFLPEFMNDEIEKFVECVNKYDQVKSNLRYLLSGKPGTGKTMTIKSIINSITGNATVLLVNNLNQFDKVFDFAKLFKPVVICVDDIDLLLGSRESGFSPMLLTKFLQLLDGFTFNNVFILATTNDKGFVDKAASRPGRFDLVLDFSKIDKENYLQLINSKCGDEKVLMVFDDEMLATFKKKKVTGAFIANLIKQIEIKSKLQPDVDLRTYAESLLNFSHKGFYEELKEDAMEFGFN